MLSASGASPKTEADVRFEDMALAAETGIAIHDPNAGTQPAVASYTEECTVADILEAAQATERSSRYVLDLRTTQTYEIPFWYVIWHDRMFIL